MSELLYDFREDKEGFRRISKGKHAPKMTLLVTFVGIGMIALSLVSYEDEPISYILALLLVPSGFVTTLLTHKWLTTTLWLYDDHLIVYGKEYLWEDIEKVACYWESDGVVFSFKGSQKPAVLLPGWFDNRKKLEKVLKKKGKLASKDREASLTAGEQRSRRQAG